MRILVVHSFYRLAGGENNYVERQIELLREYHDVTLLRRSNEILTSGLSTALRMTWSPAVIREVEECIDATRPEVVHLHNAYPGLGPAVHFAAERRGVPLVMTVHNARLRCPNGLMFTKGSLCQRCEHGTYGHAVFHHCFPSRRQAAAYAAVLWAHRFPLRLERKVAVFIAPSAFMARQLLRWGVAPQRVDTIPNFTPSRPDASAEPGSYGLYLGRLASEKGVETLLRALRKSENPPFRIVGTGPLEQELRQLAKRLKLDNTEFMGRLGFQAVGDALGAARFVVIPSQCPENAPLAALEALAAGRPLLVSDMGGLPELIDSGAGLSFKAGDVEELAQRLGELMNDAEYCRRLGGLGLQHSKTFLSPESHRRGLEAAYCKALRLGAAARKV